MLKRIVAAAAVAAGLAAPLVVASPASAAGQACYSLHAQVNGQDLINQEGCQPLG